MDFQAIFDERQTTQDNLKIGGCQTSVVVLFWLFHIRIVDMLFTRWEDS